MVGSGLRAKITLLWAAATLVASAATGYLIYYVSNQIYRESFLSNKLAVAKTIARSIDGDLLPRFSGMEATRDPEYRRYLAYFHAVKANDPYISYLYTVIRDPGGDGLLYAVDADIVEADTVWVETDYFAFRMTWRDARPVITYEEEERTPGFPVEIRAGITAELQIREQEGKPSLWLGDTEIFRVLAREPLSVTTPGGPVDLEHREAAFQLAIPAAPQTVFVSYSAAGEAGATPGSDYVDTPEGMEQVRALLRGGNDYIETVADRDNYGSSLSAFAVVRSSQGTPTGVVSMDFYQNQLDSFQARLRISVALVTGITFIIILAASLFMAQYLLVPIRRMATAVATVTRGDLEVQLRMPRRDELGQLAEGFNGMLSSLRQYRRERVVAEAELSHLAYFDQLTGLPNRKSFYDRLEETLSVARRSEHEKLRGVLFLDLDRFKDVNDTLGHPLGDRVLKAAGQRIRSAVRNSDLVFRQGGDEFTVILNTLAAETDAAVVADKLLRAFSDPISVDQNTLHVGLSVGIALFPRDGSDGEGLVRSADIALYEAKKERNGYKFFAPRMQEKALEKLSLVSSMHRGLASGQFLLHFQPVMDLRDKIVGCEALLRWRHPELGSVPPASFIPIAEETGLILPLGRLGILQSCRLLQRLDGCGGEFASIAVNLSVKQLRDAGLVADVQSCLERFGVDPNRLELEITESGLMDEPTSLSSIQELRKQGVRFSIDDFGTGYSSLARLRTLPIDTLKIDRSFIAGAPADRRDSDLVRAVITIAHGFGQRVCAEGVETREQLDFLRSVDCDMVQGFLFGQPVPEDEFVDLVRGTPSGR